MTRGVHQQKSAGIHAFFIEKVYEWVHAFIQVSATIPEIFSGKNPIFQNEQNSRLFSQR
jgi:hypothetical protein